MENKLILKKIDTPLGNFIAGVYQDKICIFEFENRRNIQDILKKKANQMGTSLINGSHPLFGELKSQFMEYLNKDRKVFDLPISLFGTEFQLKVWKKLQEIPYGCTISYSELANRIGNPKAVRGVGRANGDNHIAIILPCHRVIDKNGSLRGYGGGLDLKKKLLDLEAQSQLIDYF